MGSIRNDSDFSRIEELIKGKTFSREEISHLTEILNSRKQIELEKKESSSYAGEHTEQVPRMHEITATPNREKQHDLERTKFISFREKSDVPVGVGASPIDIARNYMAGRASEQSHDLYSHVPIGERAQPISRFSRQPLMTPASSKPSICWPGAMANDHNGYATPQSQRSRRGILDFPRTPYSRTILSRSTTKLQADSRFANTSSPFHQSQTPFYGQVKSGDESVDAYGSVGPIRRIRNKFASEIRPGRSILLNSPKDIPSDVIKSNVFKDFLPSTDKNLEHGETSGTSKYLSGDNASSSYDTGVPNPATVRKILEHLDRNKPTPKEKEAELKLVTDWKKASPNEENRSVLHFVELSSNKSIDKIDPNFPVEFNKSKNSSNNSVKFNNEGTNEAKDAVNGNPKTPNLFFSNSGPSTLPSFGLKGTSGTVVKNLHENPFLATNSGQETSFLFPRPPLSNGQDSKISSIFGSEVSRNHGSKPSLPSISINKPTFSSENNATGFTFPVSASSGVLSEPPTPSFMPPSSQNTVPTVPSYDFGTKKSTPSHVFSFPDTSTALIPDASDLKFSFESDKKTRLSFSSFGKDAICH